MMANQNCPCAAATTFTTRVRVTTSATSVDFSRSDCERGRLRLGELRVLVAAPDV